MLNLFQHLIKSICYETLKRVQGDKKLITTQSHRQEGSIFEFNHLPPKHKNPEAQEKQKNSHHTPKN